MPLHKRMSLTRFLIENRKKFPHATGALNGLLLDIALATKAISHLVARGKLADLENKVQLETNVQGEEQKPLDVIANQVFIERTHSNGHLCAIASEEMEDIYEIPPEFERGKYLLVFDPLDGSSNLDVNVSVGSIFSILRKADDSAPSDKDFFVKGCNQIAAGYAIYGPQTILVLSVGDGVHAFTLDNLLGEYFLTHENIQIPQKTQEFAINASNSRFWEAPVKRYVDECLEGKSGPRGKDFNMRWIASMVAEAHRIFMRGGVFMYPKDNKDPKKQGRLRLLYEANPIGFLVEQAGGRVSNGYENLLQLTPNDLHQRIGVIFGSKAEVELIETYHNSPITFESDSPLFGTRSLFRN